MVRVRVCRPRWRPAEPSETSGEGRGRFPPKASVRPMSNHYVRRPRILERAPASTSCNNHGCARLPRSSQVVYGWELRLSAEWTVPTSPAGMHTHARTTCTGGCWNKTSATTSLQWLRRSTYCRVLISTAGQTITSRSYSRIHRNVVGPVFY